MVPLTTAWTTFEARVVSARLGAAGILTRLVGESDGPYPLPGPVLVLVEACAADDARALLLADRVEDAFFEVSEVSGLSGLSEVSDTADGPDEGAGAF